MLEEASVCSAVTGSTGHLLRQEWWMAASQTWGEEQEGKAKRWILTVFGWASH